ncbi:cyclin-like protein [Usnea florida]
MPTATESSQSLPPSLPSEILMVAETQWLFTEAELLRTPSILDGLTPEKERENRSKGVNFILQVGIMLKLPQITLAAASVFLHRFYMRHSMQTYHYYSMAATCLFLAYKVEECVRKMRELVVACVRVAQKDPHKNVDEQDKEYWRWRDNILQYEDLLLEAICFDLSLEPPYKTLFDLLMQFEQGDNKRLRNAAWAFVNDSCLTTLCLLFPSRTIAASALYAAAKHCDVAFPDDARGRPWWEVIDIDIGSIRRACNYMASIYENSPAKGSKESGMYERTPENDDGREDKTRSAGLRKIGDSGSSRGSNDSLLSPTVVSPEGSQAGAKRGREEEEEGEVEPQPQASVNGTSHGANGTAVNQARSTKRQKVTDEPSRNAVDPKPGQASIPHRPTTARHPQQQQQQQPGDEIQAETAGGINEEEDGSEEGEVEA